MKTLCIWLQSKCRDVIYRYFDKYRYWFCIGSTVSWNLSHLNTDINLQSSVHTLANNFQKQNPISVYQEISVFDQMSWFLIKNQRIPRTSRNLKWGSMSEPGVHSRRICCNKNIFYLEIKMEHFADAIIWHCVLFHFQAQIHFLKYTLYVWKC